MDIKLDSLQTIIIILTCLVPGFIIHSTYSLFTVRRKEAKELLFLRFVTFTALNFIVCLLWVRFILAPNFIRDHPWRTIHYLVTIIFGSPIVLGLTIAFIDHWQVPRRFTRLFGLHSMHSTPTAWDYCFNQIVNRGPRFVIVTFKDGKQIGGMFSHPAVASSDASERDIYLIGVHNLIKDENGDIRGVYRPQNDGILIVGGEVRSFEFFLPSALLQTKLQKNFTRACHIAKITRQEAERRLVFIRWTGVITRTLRNRIRRANSRRQDFILEVDRRLEEEKNGIKEQ